MKFCGRTGPIHQKYCLLLVGCCVQVIGDSLVTMLVVSQLKDKYSHSKKVNQMGQQVLTWSVQVLHLRMRYLPRLLLTASFVK